MQAIVTRALEIAVAIPLAACSFTANGLGEGSGSGSGSGSALDDARPIDAFQPDTPKTEFCVGDLVMVCPPSMPPALTLMGDVDTTPGATNSICFDWPQQHGGHVCALLGNGVTIKPTRIFGTRPAVIASYQDIDVQGVLDASSDGDHDGPGADDGGCTNAGGPANGLDGGGGAGATFAGDGGDGGTGASGTAAAGQAGPAAVELISVRGGCQGQRGGGIVVDHSVGGGGGHSGGGVLISAMGKIHVEGAGGIDASGNGGSPGAFTTGGGGGGGGTGGWIGLEAGMTITFDGQSGAWANGGGGGGGDAQQALAGAAQPGAKGTRSTTAASGGAPSGGGGRGGIGSSQGGASNGSDAANGGGGGGGGAGEIVVLTGALSGGMFSPSLTPP